MGPPSACAHRSSLTPHDVPLALRFPPQSASPHAHPCSAARVLDRSGPPFCPSDRTASHSSCYHLTEEDAREVRNPVALLRRRDPQTTVTKAVDLPTRSDSGIESTNHERQRSGLNTRPVSPGCFRRSGRPCWETERFARADFAASGKSLRCSVGRNATFERTSPHSAPIAFFLIDQGEAQQRVAVELDVQRLAISRAVSSWFIAR